MRAECLGILPICVVFGQRAIQKTQLAVSLAYISISGYQPVQSDAFRQLG